MPDPSWWYVAFALIVGGALGFWCCAAMAAGAIADAQEDEAFRRRTVEQMARESQR